MKSEELDFIVKVLMGVASSEERQNLLIWLGEDKENMDIFKQSESIWNALEIINTDKDFDSDKAFETFKTRLNDRLKKSRRLRLYRTIDRIIRIAAIVIIIFGIPFILIYNQDKSDKKRLTSYALTSEIIAPRGSKTQISLTDGTKVWLNSDSKLIYQKNFKGIEREVYLEGEGYFEVSRLHGKPFIVNTSDLIIRAFGTSFNVKSYQGEETTETTLIEGKIEVESKLPGHESESVFLEPNQKATHYNSPESLQKDNVNMEKIKSGLSSVEMISELFLINKKVDGSLAISWKNNVLYFENEMFQDLAVKIERRFDVNIHFLDETIKRISFSGKFKDIIINQVLAALQFASPFYYSINDKDIYISEKPINQSILKHKSHDQ